MTQPSLVYQSTSPPPVDPITGCAAGYTSLGGVITSEPTAAVINNKLIAFVRGTDNAIYYKYSTGGNFSNYISLGGGTYQSPKSAVINGTLYIEVIGTDNLPYYKSSADGINYSNWMQGTGDAQTNPIIDFNGFTFNFEQGQQVAQPSLCLGMYVISNDVSFDLITSSNNGSSSNFVANTANLNLALNGQGTEVCSVQEQIDLKLNFREPFNAVNMDTDPRFRFDAKTISKNNQFHIIGTNEANLLQKYVWIYLDRDRPNQPEKTISLRLMGSRTDGSSYSGRASVNLHCP